MYNQNNHENELDPLSNQLVDARMNLLNVQYWNAVYTGNKDYKEKAATAIADCEEPLLAPLFGEKHKFDWRNL